MAILSIKCSSLVGRYPALLPSLLQRTLADWIDVVNKDHHRHFDPLYVIHSLVAYCKYAQSYLMRWILSSLRGHFEHDYERIYLRFPHGWRTFLVAYLLGHGVWVVVPVSINSTIWILAVGWDRNWVAITCVCYGNFCKRMLSIHKNAGVDDDTDGYAKRIARGDNRWPIDIVCACGWSIHRDIDYGLVVPKFIGISQSNAALQKATNWNIRIRIFSLLLLVTNTFCCPKSVRFRSKWVYSFTFDLASIAEQ